MATRPYSAAEQVQVEQLRASVLVAAELRALAETLAIDELVVITWVHVPATQRKFYEWMAPEFL